MSVARCTKHTAHTDSCSCSCGAVAGGLDLSRPLKPQSIEPRAPAVELLTSSEVAAAKRAVAAAEQGGEVAAAERGGRSRANRM
jgi:hypothetical protein